jgi:transcriptional regulator NrdR family protein
MICDQCGGKTEVRSSLPGINGTIRRRRECPSCQTRFTTYELRGADYEKIRDEVEKQIRKDIANEILKAIDDDSCIRHGNDGIDAAPTRAARHAAAHS